MIEKICQNEIYKECMKKVINTSQIDMKAYINSIYTKAMEIAEKLRINTTIIEKAVALTYIGLAIEEKDYIQSSGILAVKILSEIGEDEDTIARVLMAIAGQGNNGDSVNLFSAIILLANLANLKEYMLINGEQKEEINIEIEQFEILYEERKIKYQISLNCEDKEAQKYGEKIEKVITNCADVLQLKAIAVF